MLRIGEKKPYWIELQPGARLLVKPLSTSMALACRRAYRGDPAAIVSTIIDMLSHQAIVEWEGIGDADGNPVEPTPEMITALMDDWGAASEFERLYVLPEFDRVVTADAEKNA